MKTFLSQQCWWKLVSCWAGSILGILITCRMQRAFNTNGAFSRKMRGNWSHFMFADKELVSIAQAAQRLRLCRGGTLRWKWCGLLGFRGEQVFVCRSCMWPLELVRNKTCCVFYFYFTWTEWLNRRQVDFFSCSLHVMEKCRPTSWLGGALTWCPLVKNGRVNIGAPEKPNILNKMQKDLHLKREVRAL